MHARTAHGPTLVRNVCSLEWIESGLPMEVDHSGESGSSKSAPPILVTLVWGTLLCFSAPAQAQFLERAIVLRNATVIAEPDRVIENASVLLKGGKIEAVGTDVRAPFLSQSYDLKGKTVTAGLIDAWGALGRLGGSDQSDPTANAWDAFDQYARDDFREATRQGVTTIYLGPKCGPGVCGTGVVVQLVPAGPRAVGELLARSGALHINLASNQPAVSRMKTFDEVRKQFRKAKDYRQALEDYDEDLKEYLDKLKERREKKEAKEKGKESGDKKDVPDKKGNKTEKDNPPGDKPRPSPEDKSERKTPESESWATRLRVWSEGHAPYDEKKPDGSSGSEDKKANGKKANEKGGEEKLTKPTKPTPDRKSEALLRAIDHKLPVRVSAHRSEDIFNALALAREFNLDLVLEGATDAYLVTNQLADTKTAVVLGPIARTGLFENNEYRRHSEKNAAALEKTGVEWTVGSGGDEGLAARFVGYQAQIASEFGGGKSWLESVTTRAAKILGLDDRIGQIAVGFRADLVVWSGDPGDPSSIVERVFVAGKPAYVAPEVKGP